MRSDTILYILKFMYTLYINKIVCISFIIIVNFLKNHNLNIFVLYKRNRETCSSHLHAFSRTAFPKTPGYFGKLVQGCPWKM